MNSLLCSLLIAQSLCISFGVHAQSRKSRMVEKGNSISFSRHRIEAPRSQSTVRILDFNGISVFKNGTAIIGGRIVSFRDESGKKIPGSALLIKIVDGKKTIRRLSLPSSIDEMGFQDTSTGWILGRGQGIFKTTDSGENWVKFERSEHFQGPVFFLDQTSGWFFGDGGHLEHIKNDQVECLKSFNNFPYVKKMQFTSDEIGWIQDVAAGEERFQRTRDGGKTWEKVKIHDDAAVDDFQFISDIEGFAIADQGLYSTNDGGDSWTLIKRQPKPEWFEKVFFLDRTTGWLVKGTSTCFTDDGGVSWNCAAIKQGEEVHLRKVVFGDRRNGWLLTEEGLYFTGDGGKTWQRFPIKVDNFNF